MESLIWWIFRFFDLLDTTNIVIEKMNEYLNKMK